MNKKILFLVIVALMFSNFLVSCSNNDENKNIANTIIEESKPLDDNNNSAVIGDELSEDLLLDNESVDAGEVI